MPRPLVLKLPQPLRGFIADLAAFFASRDLEVYAQGGFLRDALLGLPVRDIDLSIAADPREIGPALADAFSGHYFPLDENRRQAGVRLPDRDLQIDLLPLRGPIDDDLRSRDYTVNALAAPLAEAAAGRITLIDPTGGLRDLRASLIRLTSDQALIDDPLRLLRGIRLAAQLDFRIESATSELIRKHAALLTTTAIERQRDELMRIFATPRAAHGLRLLDEMALLDLVLPEMAVARGVQQPKEHYYDVLGHSFAAVEALEWIMTDSEPKSARKRQVTAHSSLITIHSSLRSHLWSQLDRQVALDYFREEVVLGTPRLAVLKLTAFLHDIGKPQTQSFEESGRMRFFGHSEAGAEIADRLLRRLRFSARETALVTTMIAAHLRPLLLAQKGAPSKRAVYRFFRDTGDAALDTLFLTLADHLATVGPRTSIDGWRRHIAVICHLLANRTGHEAKPHPPIPIDGDDLMAALDLQPGAQLGRLLALIREAHALGQISTKDEAIQLAREHLDEITS